MASSLGLLIQGCYIEHRILCSRSARYGTIIPAGIFASVGTLLQLAALLYIPAAVLAGLRGAFIAWTAIVSAQLGFKDAPGSSREWAAVGAAAIGAIAVGGAAAGAAAVYPQVSAGGEGGAQAAGAGSVLLGLSLSLAGYAVATAQVAFEQRYIDALGFSRWEILGVEGVIGSVVCAVFLALLGASSTTSESNGGRLFDDPLHTMCCLVHGGAPPAALSTAYGLASLTFNALLLAVAGSHGPNLRVFVFTARGAITWVVEAVAAALGAPGGVGRGSSLTVFAGLEATGWALLIAGGVARVHWQKEREAHAEKTAGNGDAAEHLLSLQS